MDEIKRHGPLEARLWMTTAEHCGSLVAKGVLEQ